MIRFLGMFACVLLLAVDSPGLEISHGPDKVLSRDQRVEASLEVSDDTVLLSASRDGRSLLSGSLGVEVDGSAIRSLAYDTLSAKASSERIKPAWGKTAEYRDEYTELTLWMRESTGLKRRLGFKLRLYDTAIAVRYEFPKEGGWSDAVNVTGELTELRFAGENQAWAYNGEQEPLGPFLLNAPPKKTLRPPLTVKRSEAGYAAVLEAATVEQASMTLDVSNEGDLRVKVPASVIKNGHTAWRVVLLGDHVGDLLTGPAPYCLNPPCEIEDTSWIKPGLAVWDWRAWGAKTDDDFTYGLDMASWRRFIDFASKHNVKYLVLDTDWYGPQFEKSSDPRTSRDYLIYQSKKNRRRIATKPAPADWDDPIDVPALIAYGKERNVGIFLYINDVARKNYPFEEVLALYESWGAAGIKYGFMRGEGQSKLLATREIVRLCAKHHLLCNFHDGPVPPSGDERTYPNYVSREFCHAQADSLRSFTPTGFLKQVFVNMIGGPLDMSNGFYSLDNIARDRPRVAQPINSTVVSETARVLVTYAAVAILPDTPESYAAKVDLFAFLSRLPMTWDETRILSGEVGEHIVTARRADETWFIGAVTNEQQREMTIPLDFLKAGTTYRATLYEDAPDAHFQSNREAYRIREVEVRSGEEFVIRMAAGGGFCATFDPAE